MRKIPEGAEAANIMVGEIEGLKYQVVALVRLVEGRSLGDLTEVPIPTRFLFFFFGPPGSQAKNIEIGRAISTIMVDQVGDVHLLVCFCVGPDKSVTDCMSNEICRSALSSFFC